MPELRPVRSAPEPTYPARRDSTRGLRRAVATATLSIALGAGACGPSSPAATPDAGEAASGAADAATSDAEGAPQDAAPGAARDASRVARRADAAPPDGVMRSATLGMPLAMGLDDEERNVQAPLRDPAPATPSPPAVPQPPVVVSPPIVPGAQVVSGKPKPPEVTSPLPVRTAGEAPLVRLPGRRSVY